MIENDVPIEEIEAAMANAQLCDDLAAIFPEPIGQALELLLFSIADRETDSSHRLPLKALLELRRALGPSSTEVFRRLAQYGSNQSHQFVKIDVRTRRAAEYCKFPAPDGTLKRHDVLKAEIRQQAIRRLGVRVLEIKRNQEAKNVTEALWKAKEDLSLDYKERTLFAMWSDFKKMCQSAGYVPPPISCAIPLFALSDLE